MTSSASITVIPYNLTYTFTGVTEITHNLSLKIDEKADTTESEGLVNGARKQPDKVTLTVIESDAQHAAGWSARMLQVLADIRARRLLCRVATEYRTYENMLLSAIAATQDETSQSGWSGDLTFTECASVSSAASDSSALVKTDTNSSYAAHTGSAGPAKTVSGSPFQQMCNRAGIAIGD